MKRDMVLGVKHEDAGFFKDTDGLWKYKFADLKLVPVVLQAELQKAIDELVSEIEEWFQDIMQNAEDYPEEDKCEGNCAWEVMKRERQSVTWFLRDLNNLKKRLGLPNNSQKKEE